MRRATVLAAGLALACLAWPPLAGNSPLRAQEKPAAKSSPAATQIYQDAASFQNNSAFELAVEEWQKLLKNHPQDPLAAKGQHYLGVCLLQLNKPDQAAAAFGAVIKKHPQFELLEDTILNLASSQYSQAVGGKPEHYAAAAETFAALVEKFPKGKYVEEARYFQGESLYAQGKKAAAASAYEKLLADFPKSKRRADALYALGVAQEELKEYAKAGANYASFLKEFAASPLATEVKMRKAETVLQAGDFAAAERQFAEVAAALDFAAADHAVFRQAYCLAKLDQFAAAGALYAKIPSDFAQSAYVPEATIAAGRSFYKADKLEEAAAWLAQSVERKDMHSPEAAHWLSRILIKNKKSAEAAELAARQLAAGGDSPFLVSLQMDRADALHELPDRRAEALGLYAKLAADHPQHELAPQALYNAAFAALGLKDFAAAVKHAATFLAAYPQDKLVPDVRYVAAESNLQLKNYDAAQAAYAELVASAKDHPEIDAWRVRLGLVPFLQKKYPETIAALSPIVGSLQSPEAAAEAHYLIGASHFFTDQFDEAAKSLAAALAAKPTWRQADETLVLLGRAQAKLGQGDAAVASLNKVIADFPASALLDQAHYRLGEIAYAADDFKRATDEYAVVLDKWPDSPLAPYALYGQGWAQLKTKQFPAGAESFTALLTRFPEHPLQSDGLFGRAMCRRQAGQAKEALADLAAYLKTNPDRAHQSDALYEMGLAQVTLKENAAAAKTLAELLRADPQYAAADKVQYELGWALKSQDKQAEAASVFDKLATEHPDSPLAAEAWFHVGEFHYDKKGYAEAALAYASSQAKAPAGELAEKGAYKLGWSHFQLKQYDEALRLFSEQLAAYGQGPLAADAAFMKAECLFRQEKYEEAWPAYQAAAKTKASTPAIETLILLHGGQSAAQLKAWDESQKLLSQIPAKFADSPLLAEALYELGWAKQNSGQPAEALKDYEAAATASRDHVGARARFMMGEIYFEQKKHDQAVREFQRAMFGYGGEQAADETKNWQAKSGYEAGRCAEVQIATASEGAKAKLLSDARRFYGFVAEKHAGHELADDARQRLEVLKKL
ncbi:MAG: tetratricopeptide repeat protein [Pirellulaceae bacterium]